MMNQIKKYLKDSGVTHEVKSDMFNNEIILITLEKDNVWVNGYGEDMLWDRGIRISQDRYKKYIMSEQTGYSMNKTHIRTGRQKDIVTKLEGLSL